MRYLRTRRGFREFLRRNLRHARAEKLVLASDTLEMLPRSGASNPRICVKAGVDQPAPMAERSPVLASGDWLRRRAESARRLGRPLLSHHRESNIA